MASPLLDGDGSYSGEIVGEARRQAELRSISGMVEDGQADSVVEQECLALLVPNSSDRNDVRVEINGREVGSLSRSDAAEYHEALGWMESFHQTFACRALITGTWDPQVESFNLSVGLDLVWPPRLASAAGAVEDDEDGFETTELPPMRRRWGGMAGTWLAGGVVSAAVILGLWLLPPEDRRGVEEPGTPTQSAAPPQAASPAGSEPPREQVAQEAAAVPPAAGCPDADTAARAWEIVQNSGVVRSTSAAGDMSVEDALWEGLPREDRIRFAFAGYCRPPMDGNRSILIVGANDKKVKGSIVQGVWLDPASATP